jgi:HAD superfamily hydrolase (TIGR01509 family)
MPVKAVVFDLDGTVASFNLDYRTVRAEVRSFLITKGLPASVLSLNESIFEMMNKAEIFLKNNDKSEKVIEKIRSEAFKIAENYELEAAKTTSLLPGVVEALRALKKMKIKIGLCTINSEKSANYILKRFGIENLFDAVTPREKVKYVKPSPNHLEVTLSALKVKPKEAMIVGDGTTDMRCAKELKVIAVGLPTGVSTAEDLINSGADYFITIPTEVPILVENINRAPK